MNPSQVQNLITNKPVAIFEASRRIVNMHCVKIPALAKNEKFLKHYNVMCYYCTKWPRKRIFCGVEQHPIYLNGYIKKHASGKQGIKKIMVGNY
jgi:hypothetical protein